MKSQVRRFKSMSIALEELKPFILNGEHLQTGRPFKLLGGMRSREALANWLICVVANHVSQSEAFFFTSDPTGGDGVIQNAQTGRTWLMEHVLVPKRRSTSGSDAGKVEDALLNAVAAKQNKGGNAYASGKQLVVFLNVDAESWSPNFVAKGLSRPLMFDQVWVVGLQSPKFGYEYSVSKLDPGSGLAEVWLVQISTDFSKWKIERIQ